MNFSHYIDQNGLGEFIPATIPDYYTASSVEQTLGWALDSDELARLNHYLDCINEVRNGDTYQLTRHGVAASATVKQLAGLMFAQVGVWACG